MARPREFDQEEALGKAMRIFWSKGYEGTSMADLTDGMGISRSSLYETFGDKKALFVKALTLYLDVTGQKRDGVLARSHNARDGMAKLFLGIISFLLGEDHPGGCFFTNSITFIGTFDAEVEELLRQNSEKRVAALTAFFQRSQQEGNLGKEQDPAALAQFFEGFLRGLTVVARMQKDRKVLEDMVKVALKVLD